MAAAAAEAHGQEGGQVEEVVRLGRRSRRGELVFGVAPSSSFNDTFVHVADLSESECAASVCVCVCVRSCSRVRGARRETISRCTGGAKVRLTATRWVVAPCAGVFWRSCSHTHTHNMLAFSVRDPAAVRGHVPRTSLSDARLGINALHIKLRATGGVGCVVLFVRAARLGADTTANRALARAFNSTKTPDRAPSRHSVLWPHWPQDRPHWCVCWRRHLRHTQSTRAPFPAHLQRTQAPSSTAPERAVVVVVVCKLWTLYAFSSSKRAPVCLQSLWAPWRERGMRAGKHGGPLLPQTPC